MTLPRKLMLSAILLFGYSATACSQTEAGAEPDNSTAAQDSAQTDSFGSGTSGESFGSGSDESKSFGSGTDDGADTSTALAKMSGEKLAALIKSLDEDANIENNRVVFEIAERELMMVYDETADRMRVISPIIQSSAVPSEVMERMLQANFDAVLDARYALGNDLVWSVFLHPLSTLTEDDFISGLAQTITAAETFGTAYTSGAVVFGGGDSNSIHQDLIEELKKAQDGRSDI